MPIKIEGKITGYKVITNTTGVENINVVTPEEVLIKGTPCVTVEPIVKNTVLSRPEKLFGATFKIKVPQHYDHGIFITLNHSYEDGLALPFEIFINTKNKELNAWLESIGVTLTTLFRSRVCIKHLLDEYRTIQDSKGGYRGKVKSWEEKPKYYTSILGELADVIEHWLGILEEMNEKAGEEAANFFLSLKEEAPATSYVNEEPPLPENDYPPSATVCPTCSAKAVVLMDGCGVCLECSYSKCS